MVNESKSLINKHKYYNNRFFAKWAGLYDYEKFILFPIRRQAAKFLKLKPPKKILDVATGTGAQAYELAKLGFDVIGIDLSQEMLAQAKKKLRNDLKLQFLHEDATKLSFKDNCFDGCFISLGLHDMPYDIEIFVLNEMKRVTKPNGKIIIVDYMEPRKHFVAKFSHVLIKLYETPNYLPFIDKGLNDILKKIDLRIDKETNFLGLVQIVEVDNLK